MAYPIPRIINILSMPVILFTCIFFSINHSKANSLEYFKLSIDEAMNMYSTIDIIRKNNNSQDIGTMTGGQWNRIIIHATKALNYSNKVKNKDLDKLDRSLFFKDFKKKYEDLFRGGLRALILCDKGRNIDNCKKSDKLINKWGDYYIEFREKFY